MNAAIKNIPWFIEGSDCAMLVIHPDDFVPAHRPTVYVRLNDVLSVLDHQAIGRAVPTCPVCKNEIDPELCHCGDYIKSHGAGSGHSPVPMGCTCGYQK